MGIDPRKRQKQLARKAAKRRAAVAVNQLANRACDRLSDKQQMEIALDSPIHECLVPAGLFCKGLGSVIISRRMPRGRIGAGLFLVDTYCLGVKNAFFKTVTEWEYEWHVKDRGRNTGQGDFEHKDHAYARKLIEDSVAYAASLGIEPHRDYEFVKRIFADIDPTSCSLSFEFGKDGKPFFIAGPNDTPVKCERILDALRERLGQNAFHYLLPVTDPNEFLPPEF